MSDAPGADERLGTEIALVRLVIEFPERLPRFDVVRAVLGTIEDIYWLALDEAMDHPYGDPMTGMPFFRDPRETYPPRMRELAMGSPLHVVLELPWPVFATAGTAFVAGIAWVFKIPQVFERSRAVFWRERLAADQAKAAWLEWKSAQQEKAGIEVASLATNPELPDAD